MSAEFEGRISITGGAGYNPYRDTVQGKANEPITVAALLDRARQLLGYGPEGAAYSLENIYDRLEYNAPRIAIIGGSPDHPAHVMDVYTSARAALRIWESGGLPFAFSVPVLCDGTAQDHVGMCYSLQSRNAMAEMVVNQMEAQQYHGAFVLQGCDKMPLALVSALGHLDRLRQLRGDAPVFASFAPAHVLKGGDIPPDLRLDLQKIAHRAQAAGYADIAEDLEEALAYILQCSSNSAFQGVLTRARELNLLSLTEHKDFEKRLAVNTCDKAGGICAFNGTGNSSRNVVAALGLVHPAVELLTEPPTQAQVNCAIDPLLHFCNDPFFSVRSIVAQNFANCLRVHSATGGSTNLMMHLVAGMVYSGYDFSLYDLENLLRRHPVPDIFDYSLTAGRDIFVLAQQCCSGQIRGMETIFYELAKQGVPLNLDAPTVCGQTWRERLADTTNLAAEGVKQNPIILARPRRTFSGVDVLRSNFFESAVVKVSGMPDRQLDEFDNKVFSVLYFLNEAEANRSLLDVNLLEHYRQRQALSHADLLALYAHNRIADQPPLSEMTQLEPAALYHQMIANHTLKIAIVIAGQGPVAYGMPEMFTPMQHINANRALKKLTVLISDGRYSGVSYGAAIGHVVPEARNRGGLLYLQDGDLLHIKFRQARRVELLDKAAFVEQHQLRPFAHLQETRRTLGEERLATINQRSRQIAASNRMNFCTDAAHGVVPLGVAEEATESYVEPDCHPLTYISNK